jgi:hypothetical protein
MSKIKTRDRDTIIQALRAGVVPKLGLQHIQVGRAREIGELVKDIERISDGGSAIRFVIGEYGSGKTFFLNLVRTIALEKGLVVMSADLAPDRRIYASGGQARALYAEMARNIATRTKPDGGAMANIVERFVGQAHQEASQQERQTGEIIQEKLRHFEDLTGGFEFANVVGKFWQGYESGDEELKSAALRWLRAEYSTKTDAKRALGAQTIINDQNVYDQLKLMSAFVRAAGYKGLLVSLDEMVNLFKLTSSQARNANYEQLLRILNDVLQGSAENIGFLFGGTPEFLMNTRRGLYSYEALQTRLSENSFARDGLVDLSGPVIRLANLTQEDLFVLLSNIRKVMQDADLLIPDEALTAFMKHCSDRIGEAYFRTPRNTVTAFVNMLSVLEQNPGTSWSDLIEKVELEMDSGDDMSDIDDAIPSISNKSDDELSSFKL